MFTLISPLRPVHWSGMVLMTQGFGENRVDFYSKMGLKGHNGIDLFTRHYDQGHAPVYASHDGYVISNATIQSNTAGRFVKLLSDEMEIDNRACKVLTIYFHLLKANVSSTDKTDSATYWKKPGERYVVAGQTIGYTNNTGEYTTGAHLHFGVYILWNRANGSFTADTTNGFDGAVDPIVYLRDGNVYLLPMSFTNNYYHDGKSISNKEANNAIPAHLKAEASSWSTRVWKANLFLRSLMGIKQ